MSVRFMKNCYSCFFLNYWSFYFCCWRPWVEMVKIFLNHCLIWAIGILHIFKRRERKASFVKLIFCRFLFLLIFLLITSWFIFILPRLLINLLYLTLIMCWIAVQSLYILSTSSIKSLMIELDEHFSCNMSTIRLILSNTIVASF